MLKLDIYGLRVQIKFLHRGMEDGVARILKQFLRKDLEEWDVSLEYGEKGLPRLIGSHIFPLLAERDIWGIHAGGFDLNGGHLTIGPPGHGKSMLSYVAMKSGRSVVSDDITLLRESDKGIEMLPFFSSIFLKGSAITQGSRSWKSATLKFISSLERGNRSPFLKKSALAANLIFSAIFLGGRELPIKSEGIKPTILKYIVFPSYSESVRSSHAVKIGNKADLLRKMSTQFLWSFDKGIQERQMMFLERLCDYPAIRVSLGPDSLKDFSRFERALNEAVQG